MGVVIKNESGSGCGYIVSSSVETVNQLNWQLLSTILVDLLGSWKSVSKWLIGLRNISIYSHNDNGRSLN